MLTQVVGILLRARRHGLVKFEGEMLFQRRDDDVTITLVKRPGEMKEDMQNRIEDLKSHPCAPSKPGLQRSKPRSQPIFS